MLLPVCAILAASIGAWFDNLLLLPLAAGMSIGMGIALLLQRLQPSQISQAIAELEGICAGGDFTKRIAPAGNEKETDALNRLLEILEYQKKQLRRSEELFGLISENAADLIAVVNVEGDRIYNSPSYKTLLGYSPEELKGTKSFTQVHPDDRAKVMAAAAESIRTGIGQRVEYRMQHKDGSWRTFESSGSVVRATSGEVEGLVIVAHDITERKLVELELLEANAYLSAIIENLGDGLLVTNTNNQIGCINPALSSMFHLKEAEVLGVDYRSIFCQEIEVLVERTLTSSKEVFTAEIDLAERKIGKAVATAINRTAADSENSVCIGTVILIRDVTAEKEIDRIKTDFISNISHELRTPLTSIMGFARVIDKKLEDSVFPLVKDEDRKIQRAMGQVTENLSIIVAETQRLTEIINDVLELANIQAGKVAWNMRPVAIADVVRSALAITEDLFKYKDLALIVDLEEGLPEIVGDKDKLIRVAINLISNAVKFTNTGSITCRAKREDNCIVVSTIDTGIGIDAVNREKIFEKFGQVGDTLTSKPHGTGLGLTVCQKIIEHHNGRIWVESTPGEGSNFSFALNLPPSDANRPA